LTREQFAELEKTITEKLGKSSSLAWRLTWRVALVIFTILGIPGAIVGWSIWSSMQSFEQTTTTNIQTQFTLLSQVSSNQITKAHSVISNDVVIKFEAFREEASNLLLLAYSSVTNQIAEEFQTPKVKQTVEAVAKGDAREILEAEVEPAVDAFKKDSLFVRTIARAQAYDFKAYQSLLEIGRGTNDNARIANQVIAEMDRSLARNRSDFSPKKTFATFVGTNFYRGPFTSDELAMYFAEEKRDQTTFNREGFVNTVADQKQPLFLPLLIEFFTNETDLEVADRVTIAISDLAKKDFHPSDFEQIQTWWNSHRNDHTNWPITDFEDGAKDFLNSNYLKASRHFHKVLEIDPSADESRALTIACDIEVGETNEMWKFAKEFKLHDARWAKWANAFVELNYGNPSNATVQFVDLEKRNPMMPLLPDKSMPGWSKLDWQLFEKLMSSEKP
jgi:hypothetical protein